MALVKPVPTEFGVDAYYWKVIELCENLAAKTNHVTLHGFYCRNACADGKNPLAIWKGKLEVCFDHERAPLGEIYAALKLLPDWNDATDA